jgi:GNAT superfamily N-acetyltransferase
MIRDATQEDADALIRLGAAFFEEAGLAERFTALDLPNIEFCPRSFLTTCEALAKSGVMLVAEHAGEVVGMLGAAFIPALWNYRVTLAQETWWYVQPDRRKGLGVALLKEFEDRATAQGVVLSAMVAELGLRGKAVGRLYEAKGYAPAESVFWKRLGAVH